ncbi:MAG TPA: hypothetical protein VMF89_01295, partial [Polyangiales bacterium]|nr:hypothetical protein [Polyangiales bacterium]
MKHVGRVLQVQSDSMQHQAARFCGDHAVVLGGSMAGLLAARALSDHYRLVTIVERDTLSSGAEPRRGVPQGLHSHGLLASGLHALEELLPRFAQGAAARGGMFRDIGGSSDWYIGGVKSLRVHTGTSGLLLSRPALEAYVRERVLACARVSLVSGHVARGLLGSARRVTGVSVAARNTQHAPRELAADLVVDTTGRGSQLPRWLEALGIPAPR